MKKTLTVLIAILTVIILCFAALADIAADDLYNEAVDLLFHSGNVTLKATAEFYLNGQWFKTAEGTWKQDGDRSFRQLLLNAPRRDGTEQHNGYTIVTEGSYYYLMEVFTPGVYRVGTTTERNSVLRRTVESEGLVRLGALLASQADLLLGRDAVTETPEGDICIKLDKDSPSAVNTVLNQFARFAAKRYFGIDYDRIGAESTLAFDVYSTKTDGILYTMRDLSLWEMTVTLRKDGNGKLRHAEGEVSLNVETAADGVKNLEIVFTADISDRGSTEVAPFDPAAYGVSLSEYGQEIYPEMEYEGIADTGELEEKAAAVWAKTGYRIYRTSAVSTYLHGNRYDVSIEDVKGSVLTACFSPDGELKWFQINEKGWLDTDSSQYDFDPKPDVKADQEVRNLMTAFAEAFCPDLADSMQYLSMEWLYETNGVVYAQYNVIPPEQEEKGLLFIVTLSPNPQIEFFSREILG